MTVGIAAAVDRDSTIVMASDHMLSVGLTSVDLPTMSKSFLCHVRWAALFAGDVTHVPPIMQKVRKELAGLTDADVVEVSSTFVRVYKEERTKFAEQLVLSPFGLDMPTFVELLAKHDTVELADMKRKIQEVDFDCEFLVAGFGPDRKPHIFTVSPPGVEHHYDRVKFWSIGSGANTALSSLMFRRVHPLMPLKRAIYHVAEAKYMSESSIGVGKESFFVTLTADGTDSLLHGTDEAELRRLWETEGQPPTPPNLDTRIPDFINMAEIRAHGAAAARQAQLDLQKSKGQP